MKTLHLMLLIGVLFNFNAVQAQLKVDNAGRVGIGTLYPNPDNQLHVIKNILISNPANSIFSELKLEVDGINTPRISTSSRELEFYNLGWEEWITIYAGNIYELSDSTLKTNIKNSIYGIEHLLMLRPVEYTMKENRSKSESSMNNERTKELGFISQEIRKIFPEVQITKEVNKTLLMDYNQLIPVLVTSIQQQQEQIEFLKNEISTMRETLEHIPQSENSSINTKERRPVLFQNQPNPFSENTKIKYVIEEADLPNASIVIFNLHGNLIKEYKIRESGEGIINVESGTLTPGKYFYSLLINGQEIDSKTMIVLK